MSKLHADVILKCLKKNLNYLVFVPYNVKAQRGSESSLVRFSSSKNTVNDAKWILKFKHTTLDIASQRIIPIQPSVIQLQFHQIHQTNISDCKILID